MTVELSRSRLGLVLMAGAVLLVVGSFGIGALLATPPSGATDLGSPILVGVQGPGGGGTVERYDEAGTRTWHRADALAYHDVTALDGGRILAAFGSHSTNCGAYASPCGRTGFRVFGDGGQKLVREWSIPVRDLRNSEIHDVEALGDGRFLVADMDAEAIYEVDRTGAVGWRWNASSFYEAPPDPTRVDWLHINDVDAIRDGRYLVSVRNANQVVVVERGEGVVEVVNADDDQQDDSCLANDGVADHDGDGDVRCGDPAVLAHQHNPQWLGEDAILVADSENDRVVELRRTDGRWQVAWSVGKIAGEGLQWPRDADRLPNGTTLVTDSGNNRVALVNESGGLVTQFRTAPLPYEADAVGPGETVGGPTIDGAGQVARPNRGEVPVFSYLLSALYHVVPVPFWVTPWHLAIVTLAIPVFVAGLYLYLTAPGVQLVRLSLLGRG
ncbi:aryl-sulfate sulfotransferase [Halobacteriales archaeon Cl-PHB]